MKSQEQRMNHCTLKSQVQNDPRSPYQTKSLQFRNIAPKAPTTAPAPAVLSSCPSSALPEATTPVSPRSVVVPAQNFALMQVAGKEGTYSLVALPTSVSSQSPSQTGVVQRDASVDRNMKLPIPRYRPARSKGQPEKTGVQERQKLSSKVAQPVQAAAQDRKVERADVCAPAKLLDPAQLTVLGPSDILATSLVTDSPGPASRTNKDNTDPASGNAQAFSTSRAPPNPAAVFSCSGSVVKPEDKGTNTRPCLMELSMPPTGGTIATTIISPAVFSKTVRLVPSPPKGKLPILPYPRKKAAALPVARLHPTSPEAQLLVSTLSLAVPPPAVAEVASQKRTAGCLRQSAPQTSSGNAPGLAVCLLKSAGKRRTKKRKAFEDMAFEARKKRSLSFSRRRASEKPTPACADEKIADISRKYRSIMPKPLLMWEVPPQLVAVSSMSAPPPHLGQELMLSHRTGAWSPDAQQPGQESTRHGPQRAGAGGHASRLPHRCPVCGRCFRFRNHLQRHVRIHSGSRPHSGPTCRKGFVHSGGLGAQGKGLHLSESRPRSALACQFCEKAFGYVGVYFSHLKEVHRVILTVEPSISQHEDDIPVEGVPSPDVADEQGHEREDPVELQIKCGRCQATTPTFADMRLHLLHVHGEDVPMRPAEGAQRGCRQAEDELVRHAAHYWRELNERRSLVTGGGCKVEEGEQEGEEDFISFPKASSDLPSHLQVALEGTGERLKGSKQPATGLVADTETRGEGLVLREGSAFNCVLCSALLSSKEEVLEHWEGWHHCRDPKLLWNALSSYLGPWRAKQQEEEKKKEELAL